jgi:ABC-type glycerol-3-phosphate transport system substrate-binding protein
MLQNSGPKGIASYGWQECLLDFQQGAAAMWLDSIAWMPAVEDPKQSKIVGKVGYSVVEGPGNRYGAADPWGFIMNAYSKNKDAAWELIRWATGTEATLAMVKDRFGRACRTRVIESDAMRANAPAEFIPAMGKAMSVADPAYKPLTKNLSEINDLTSIAISKVLTGQATAAASMKEANDAIRTIMKRDGYIR